VTSPPPPQQQIHSPLKIPSPPPPARNSFDADANHMHARYNTPIFLPLPASLSLPPETKKCRAMVPLTSCCFFSDLTANFPLPSPWLKNLRVVMHSHTKVGIDQLRYSYEYYLIKLFPAFLLKAHILNLLGNSSFPTEKRNRSKSHAKDQLWNQPMNQARPAPPPERRQPSMYSKVPLYPAFPFECLWRDLLASLVCKTYCLLDL
jgi:hypothetical protein